MRIAVFANNVWWIEDIEAEFFDDLAVSVAQRGLHTADVHGALFIPPQAIECIRSEASVKKLFEVLDEEGDDFRVNPGWSGRDGFSPQFTGD